MPAVGGLGVRQVGLTFRDGETGSVMPRERRVEDAGAIYHAMARGNRRGDIVVDNRDRCRFVETLEEVVEASGWVLYGWVLMRAWSRPSGS